jgi:leader peptidase (prepilin peptidase)/N-methyltransferase
MLARVVLLIGAAAAGGALAAMVQQLTSRQLLATARAVAVLRSPAAVAMSTLAGAGLCAALAWRIGAAPVLLADGWVAGISPALVGVDVLEQRLPNALTIGSYPILGVLLAVAAAVGGDAAALRGAGAGALVVGGFFLLIAVASRGGLGAGDVKLAVLTAAVAGWYGLGAAIVSAIAGLLCCSIVGAIHIVIGRQSRHSRIPFGPSILAGMFTIILFH